MLAATTAVAQPAVPRNLPPATVVPAATTPAAAAPQILSADDVALYKEIMQAERNGQYAKAKTLFAKVSDTSLQGYVEAEHFLSASSKSVNAQELVDWLQQYRDLAVAEKIYRLAVQHSTRKIRHHHKTILVAVVTNIPAPSGVGRRTGGYEDVELPEPVPSSAAATGVMAGILAAIKADQPDQALALMQSVQASCTLADNAVLAHRVAASYRAEGRDADAYRLAISVSDPSVPQLMWDAGFAAYRLGDWANAEAQLEKLAETPSAQNSLRAQAAFWAARAHMQSGDPQKVVTLLNFAAEKEPSFYGIIAERMLGIDTQSGFADAILNQGDFHDLMAVPAAHRAVALWQIGENEFVGSELNRAFVNNNERLDPAMAALARGIGVPNVELRASEASAARGIMLTGLFPVPPYSPDGGYRIDSALVLAFARIESRFQTQATSPVGARGLMQLMPTTAVHFGVSDPDTLYNPGTSLEVGQRYVEQLLLKLDGNLLELGGAYNAGPGAVDRWRSTKAGGNDPLLFVESIPVAETRSYVKRLMLYHWLYRRRFGQDAKSLEETASGQWPIYRPYHETVPAGATASYGLKINAQN
ncbi:MAG TPA: lytic transglycosylase domain-containing protein [Rhizomicrobium sp.]|jgi:soluble lytic murein transglycosylase-like protein|nr:lytic transglycosylase domain-containing protein [Rhizomicrobium sp.]